MGVFPTDNQQLTTDNLFADNSSLTLALALPQTSLLANFALLAAPPVDRTAPARSMKIKEPSGQ
jgi:hypothetical protein